MNSLSASKRRGPIYRAHLSFTTILQPTLGPDLSRPPLFYHHPPANRRGPIYRAHRRFIGPRWIFRYPDEKVTKHHRARGDGAIHPAPLIGAQLLIQAQH